MKAQIEEITQRIKDRSKKTRSRYIQLMKQSENTMVSRGDLACGNLAHAFAACADDEKVDLSGQTIPNIGIVTAYNDMLSAHKTYEKYPNQLRKYARENGGVAQVASGVPAMCDGVTQGQVGMELSLLSRDVIALSTAVGMSHQMFDAGICLGICDKIVPGMMIGALKFGHLPFIFLPGGPMESGISNEEKALFRRKYADGKIGRDELLKAESASYHSAGTCTFYGTANSNQMLMEIMGVHLPGSSFITPKTKLRELLNEYSIKRLLQITKQKEEYTPLYEIITEESIVNAIVGLAATGGSTNHTIHLIAIARAAGIIINWDDFDEVSNTVPLITRVYPNGSADINHFQACGGMAYLIKTLRDDGFLNEDVKTVVGKGLEKYEQEPKLDKDGLIWIPGPVESLDKDILRSVHDPFSKTGGLRCLTGNLGRSIIKVSAVLEENQTVKARAEVFDDQDEVIEAFKKGRLNKDVIVVVKNQGAHSNGMPELHKLTPTLTLLQNQGFKVALVTDGRMSGASGKVPAAIHLSPEGTMGGIISKIQTGDLIELDAIEGTLNCLNIEDLKNRQSKSNENPRSFGVGRELFNSVRPLISASEEGASFIV